MTMVMINHQHQHLQHLGQTPNSPKKTLIRSSAKPETVSVSCVSSSGVRLCILRMARGVAIDTRATRIEIVIVIGTVIVIVITRGLVGGERLVRIGYRVVVN